MKIKTIWQDYVFGFAFLFHLLAYFITRYIVFGLKMGVDIETNPFTKILLLNHYIGFLINMILMSFIIFTYFIIRKKAFQENNINSLTWITLFYFLFGLHDFLNDLAFVLAAT